MFYTAPAATTASYIQPDPSPPAGPSLYSYASKFIAITQTPATYLGQRRSLPALLI